MFNPIKKLFKSEEVVENGLLYKESELDYCKRIAQEFLDSYKKKLEVVFSYNNITDKSLFSNALSEYLCKNLEANFYRLDDIEKNFIIEKTAVFDEYSEGYFNCQSTKANICQKLCNINSVSKYYPELDNLGYFENDYDTLKYIEQIKFGEITGSDECGTYEFCEYDIDITKQAYKNYREQLYVETIHKICDEYLAAVVFDLSSAELSEVLNIYRSNSIRIPEASYNL